MQIEKSVIVKAMRAVMPGVDVKGAIQGSDTFLFTNNNIYTFSGKVGVQHPMPMDGETFAVKAADFYALICKMSEELIEITKDGNKIQIVSGKTKAKMPVLASDEAVDMANKIKLPKWKKIPEGFKEAVQVTKINNLVENLKGIYCNGKNLISTDQVRVCKYDFAEDIDEFFLDDDVAVSATNLGKIVEYGIAGAWVSFKYENGAIFSATRRDHANYPAQKLLAALDRYNTMTPVGEGKLPEAITTVIDRVAILAGKDSSGVNDIVRLTFSKDKIEVYCAKDSSEAEDECAWDSELKWGDHTVSTWIAIGFLKEAVKKQAAFKLLEFDGNSGKRYALIFVGDKYQNMVACTTIK